MAEELTYKCQTLAQMASRAVSGDFYADTISQLVFSEDPDEVVVEVDMTGPIGPVSNKQVVRISVLPHHAQSQDVAERIWENLDWDEVEGDDWVEPSDIDVRAKGWDCRMTVRY